MSSLLRSGKVISRFSPAESPALGQFPGNTWVARALRRPGHSSRASGQGLFRDKVCLSPAPTGSHGPCNNTSGKSLPLFGPFFTQEATCSSGVWVCRGSQSRQTCPSGHGSPLATAHPPSLCHICCPHHVPASSLVLGSDRWGTVRGAAGRTSPELSPEQCLKPDLLAQ